LKREQVAGLKLTKSWHWPSKLAAGASGRSALGASKKRDDAEFRLHCAAVDFLDAVLVDCIFWHTPNGEKRDPETAKKLKRMRVLGGVFDLIVMDPAGNHYYLELKAEKGTLNAEQTWFRTELIRRGVHHAICRDLKDLELFIQHHRIPNRIATRPKQAPLPL
jgi:hypothetical protein